MAYLVLVRHGQSEWNALGLWTGLKDVGLTEQGKQEARTAAEALKDISFDKAHTSKLARAKQTLAEIKTALGHNELDTSENEALNERHYGHYTGQNKWEIQSKVGEAEFNKIRRGWDHPTPGGETLKQVSNRALPYFEKNILQDLKAGKNVIVAAHGNSLRTLIKHLDEVADDDAHKLEIGTGEVLVYEISENGQVLSKEIRAAGGKA